MVQRESKVVIEEIIIGGDFNIDLNCLNDKLIHTFKIQTWNESGKNIDGFVYDSTRRSFVTTTQIQGIKGLDHSPVKAQLGVILSEPEE